MIHGETKVAYIINFIELIYKKLRIVSHFIPNEIWDNMMEKVKTFIYMHKGKKSIDTSTFYQVISSILIDRWTKSCSPSPLHGSLFES
ncbi:hypothetical protein CR513_13669, partial [Mucuna pruriens]